MANRKTQLMSKFYQECQQKGYTDMRDSTQSLKAKVIATDLGLDYGNIIKFYDEAKKCYELVCAEEVENDKRLAEQRKKDEEERKRRAVSGELLLTLSDDSSKKIYVWIRPDASIYTTFSSNGIKAEGAPAIQIKKAGATLFKYHPSEAVFTSATVGGITTGGVHYTKDGYSSMRDNRGKGEITVSASGRELVLNEVTMSEYTKNKFKRDEQYRSLVKDGQILCFNKSDKADFYADGVAIAAKSGDYTLMINAANMAADERRLPYGKCVEIANLVGRIAHGQFPPSDEEIYQKAEADSKSTNASDLKRAIDVFNSLGDYRDARSREKELQPKYDEALQSEKEQAVLKKEANKKKKRLAFMVPKLCVTAMFVLMAIMVWTNTEYSKITAIFVSISALLSVPKIGELMFREKYGCLQRIIRWAIIAVVFFIGFAFSV